MSQHPFSQVDVFTSGPLTGNPVAVVHDADGVDDETMARFANWTNLSETTFILSPTDPSADYRLRIFTPASELPFAGHPTLGSAHAWLASGGKPKGEKIIQECGIGLVSIAQEFDQSLAFAAPPLIRSGPVDEVVLHQMMTALDLGPGDVTAAAWTDTGPGWVSLMVTSADLVLRVQPDLAALTKANLAVGLVGPYRDPIPGEPEFEVRAFAPALGVPEDPVTGSLNAGLAVWLRSEGLAPAEYVASQGTALGRAGRVRVRDDGTSIWIGGASMATITGDVAL